ncbi:MAG: hypothetical protein F6K30_04435 [Cyanothece sp. SIO2G6]|nr:hypothetical protein [Cyanothece sp. SIO2G6]
MQDLSSSDRPPILSKQWRDFEGILTNPFLLPPSAFCLHPLEKAEGRKVRGGRSLSA